MLAMEELEEKEEVPKIEEKKEKKEKKKRKREKEIQEKEKVEESTEKEEKKKKKKKKKREVEVEEEVDITTKKNKKKKKRSEDDDEDRKESPPSKKKKSDDDDGDRKESPPSKKKKSDDDDGDRKESPPPKKKRKSRPRKRVRFSDELDYVPPTDKEEFDESELVRGKRFTPEEDEMVKNAVFHYIETNQLGEDGLHMVLNVRQYPQIRNCWKEIGKSLPWRPMESVYYRGHILFERSEKRGFDIEEIEIIRRFHAEHGPRWKQLAEILGKQRTHVKDAWRRIRLTNEKRGRWSQYEYQTLFDLVNLDLRLKAFQERKKKHCMIKEDISWEAISDKLSTRSMSTCCHKWYDQLASPLVRSGEWADADDYLLLDALQKQDACCLEDVDWDSLLETRDGEICRKRWGEMVRHIGGNKEISFIEQVDVLAKRYSIDMLPYRKGEVE